MFIAAIFHKYTFSHKEYEDGSIVAYYEQKRQLNLNSMTSGFDSTSSQEPQHFTQNEDGTVSVLDSFRVRTDLLCFVELFFAPSS